MSKVIIIGSGFSSLSAACCLAKKGYQVTILEKNETVGGRARQFEAEGFTFDMGPSWYWMPDVFESFFEQFGYQVSDFYDLKKLDPGFSIWFGQDDILEVPASEKALYELFESLEPGSALKLKKFLKEAAYKYEVGMRDLVYQPGLSITEFFDIRILKSLFYLGVFQSFSKHVRQKFKHPKLIQLLEFPVLFLGATPQNTPALYSLMNHAALAQGTFYPMKGMFQIIAAMKSLAEELGVEIRTNCEVNQIKVENGKATGVYVEDQLIAADIVVAGADYHHIEQKLLDPQYRQYSDKYWDTRKMAPSSLIYYLGVDKKIPKLHHHNLFFDTDFEQHAADIYETPKYPKAPLFYICCPSKTDQHVAPAGKENLFLLVPLAPGLQDSPELRASTFRPILKRLEKHCGTDIESHIIYQRSYSVNDFKKDYHAFKGNAYGLANTLMQTAILKPRMKNQKVENLFYTGQLTVPGPGVPPSLISGIVVSDLISKVHRLKSNGGGAKAAANVPSTLSI